MGAKFQKLSLEKRKISLAENGFITQALLLLKNQDGKKFLMSGATIRKSLTNIHN